MKRLSLWILLFAILSLVFFNLLIFLRIEFPPYRLMSYQDAIDVLTPLVLIPIYWILFRYAARQTPGLGEAVAFLLLAALWVEGQGMHLSANSVNNLMEGLSDSGLIDLNANDIHRLSYFYDEHLGHYLWHFGVVGLAALLMWWEWKWPAGQATAWPSTIVAGVIYSFTVFTITVEGQTVWLGLPFAILVTLFGLVRGRQSLGQRPVLAFFTVSCLLASLFYVGWGLYWGGFPGFVDVGWI